MFRRAEILAWCWVVFGALWCSPMSSEGQTSPTNLPAGVQDVVRLTRAGMTEEVVLAQLKSAGVSYKLTPDQLVYLSDQGVSQNVIKTLLQANNWSAAGAAGARASQPAGWPPVSFEYFRDALAPYGTWLQIPAYGWCWHPTAASADPNWRPYNEQGHWLYTDFGWFWHSDYSWGQITFHYGRWFRDDSKWVWAPGYDWAAAWVCWRESEGYLGWAPLPPAAGFKAGIGLQVEGGKAAESGFGLGPEFFTFVACDHFWDRNLAAAALPADRAAAVFKTSVVKDGYRMDQGRLVVDGPGRERVAALTGREVKIEKPMPAHVLSK